MFEFEKDNLNYKSLYQFQGSKRKHIDFINSLINKSNKNNYCEPFLGSGIVFLNLQKEFSSYYLNDIQEENLLAFKNASLLNEEYIRKVNDFCMKNYLETYDGYYAFRDNLLNRTDNSCLEKSIYIARAYSLCRCGMVRFNKKKFNVSYGNRKFNVDNYINAIKVIQDKNPIISNKSFADCLNIKNALYFLDPPYIKNEMGLSKNFNRYQLQVLIDFILTTDNDFIYFDTENDINEILKNKFNFVYLNKMHSTNIKFRKDIIQEICFWRIK